MNRQICDGSTSVESPCDELCGGAGCDGKCGGLSCLNGALSKADEALSSAKLADRKLVEIDRFVRVQGLLASHEAFPDPFSFQRC